MMPASRPAKISSLNKNTAMQIRKILLGCCLVALSGISAWAQNHNPKLVKDRADRLSDQMIRELRLNNFQANRLREINHDKVAKMMTIEQKHASNPAQVDKDCKGVCKERDKELESFLSFDQYGKYYGNRSEYYKYDKDFAAKIGLIKPVKESNPLNGMASSNGSLENTSTNNSVIKPNTNK